MTRLTDRPRPLTRVTAASLAVPLLTAALPALAADPLDLIGYTNLLARDNVLQSAGGTNIPVAQVEVPATPDSNDYAPDTALAPFTGKDFTYRSGATGVSGHATLVAAHFYGYDSSPAPGVTAVSLFSASSFLDGVLRTGRAARAPGRAGALVINNSWIAAYASDATNVDAVRRLDDLIHRDDILVFNAVGNTPTDPFPKLLATSYNGVSVGTLKGSFGPVSFDAAAPRAKPDLVVDTDTTSVATALASGAGALLRGAAADHKLPAGELAIKSILMASADRNPAWHRGRPTRRDNVTAPLDHQQGAGQLRVDQAYDVLLAGPQSVESTSLAPDAGWDYARTPRRRNTVRYALHVDRNIPDWNAVLTWNRLIAGAQDDGAYSTDAATADLDLALYLNKKGGKRLVAYSDSPVDNVETLQLATLSPGDYQLVLTTDTRSTYYALAWYADPDGAANTAALVQPTPAPAFPGEPAQSATAGFTAVSVPEPSTLLWLTPTLLLTRRRRHRRHPN